MMYIRLSIPDVAAIAAIGITSWILEGHQVGLSLWIGLGSFAAGRLAQWIITEAN